MHSEVLTLEGTDSFRDLGGLPAGDKHALGVTRVIDPRDDFERQSQARLSGEWLDSHLEALRGYGVEVTPTIAELVGASPAAALDRALSSVVESKGSVLDYLRAAGVTDDTLATLEQRFTK